MHLLVLSINYAPEPTGFAPHTAALCEHLAGKGHSVTVITGFPFAPYWLRWPEYRGKFVGREHIKGVQVLRVTHHIPRRPGRFFQRLAMEGSYCLTAAWAALLIRSRWDMVLYVGAQPSIAMLARLIAWVCRVPYVVKITDLATQAAVDVSIVQSPWLARMLSRFEYSAYCHASGAIVLCPSFQEALVAHRYPAERIRVIHNSEDLELIRPLPSDHTFRREHHLSPDDFVVLYSGSMGIKQGLVNVVQAARFLKETHPAVKWVLVGEGELKPALQQLVAEYDLAEHVRLLPLQPEARMSEMYSAADVLLLNQLSTVKDTVIPGKLQTYMVAGRAILAAVNPTSQAALLLNEARGGVPVAPQDPEALAAAVARLHDDPAELEIMGQRNRQFAEKHFDQREVMAAQEEFLLQIVNEARGRCSQTAAESALAS